MTYTLRVWYAATPEHSPQIHSGLTAEQVKEYIHPEVGFLFDLIHLGGRGVHKFSLEAEA